MNISGTPGNRDFTFRYENIFPRTASVTSFFDAVRKSEAGDSLGAACYKRLIPAAKAKAVNHTRDIPQTFWRDDRLPWLELRSTGAAARPISTTATPSSRWGRLSRGKRAACALAGEYLLQPGDLIVIPPHAPHSCNPLHGRPRSYHMLYTGRDMVPRAARIFPPGASITSPQPLLRDSPLFASFQQVVALMSRGSLEQLPALAGATPARAAAVRRRAAGATSRQRPAVSAPGDGSAGVAVAG